MQRIMKPASVAVIGASAEDGKIGNSVMKNLINGGYPGEIYRSIRRPRRSWGARRTECQGRAGRDRRGGVRDPREVVAPALEEVGEKNSRRRADSFRLRRDRQREGCRKSRPSAASTTCA